MKNIKRFVSMLLAIAMVLTMVVTASATAMFSDIDGHWAQEYIEYWVGKGVINGYADGTFKPNNQMTRAEVCKVLMMAYEMPQDVEPIGFTDVSEKDWFATYVNACASFGSVNGYPDNTFRPNGKITRSEAVKMVALSAGLTEEATGVENFTDYAKVPAWSLGYWNALYQVGAISGDGDGTLRPNDNITRAEVIKLLCFVVKEIQIYEMSVSISDNQGNVVSDKASYLTGEAYIVGTLLPMLVTNRANFEAVYPSGDMRDLLDAGIEIAKAGYANGWTEEDLAAWKTYLEESFSAVEADNSLIELLTNVNAMIAVVERDADYVMTFFDTEEGRTDIQYTVTIRVEVMK